MNIGQLCKFYSSLNIIWVKISSRMRWAGHVECMGENRNVYRVLVVGRYKWKRKFGRPKCKWDLEFWLWGGINERENLEDLSVNGIWSFGCEEV